jgi:nucleoside-diphosphate-sugar epimerase
MRVFVTGAAGFIGQAVVKELLRAGHQVLGLARSDKNAETLAALGAEVHRGSLDDLESLKQGATASDGVIHLAFIHDFSDLPKSCRADRLAIEAMGTALAGSNRPFIITSATILCQHGRLVTEEDVPDLSWPYASIRGPSEQLALSFVSKGVRASVVRLPPTNHGDGDRAFITGLIAIARQKGVSGYIGDGLNRWGSTHRFDVARVYRLALEKGSAGATYHAVAEEGVCIKDIAEVIGKQLNVPIVSKTTEEAQEHFGWLALTVGEDNPSSSTKTQELLGWSPEYPSLISDLKERTYFKN